MPIHQNAAWNGARLEGQAVAEVTSRCQGGWVGGRLTYGTDSLNLSILFGPSLKSALRPPPSALAESANFRPFYVKRADFSPPPPATKKRRKLVKIRPRCPHLATKKRRKVVKIRPCGGWWVGGWFPPLFFFNLITVKWSWYKIGDVIDVIKVINMTDVMNVINQCK